MFSRGWWMACVLSAGVAGAQDVPAPAPPASSGTQGKVLFSTEQAGSRSADQSETQPAVTSAAPANVLPGKPVTDAERSAISVTSYDLDVHLTPASAAMVTQARLTIRNVSAGPVNRIPLQISSTLHVSSVSEQPGNVARAMPFTESPVATDADHTGYAEEALLVPSEPLAAGASVTVNVLYGGTIAQSSERLNLLGVSPDRAAETDWDRIAPVSDASATALRGFGNVLWYPVAAPLALLGDGNRLFAIAGEQKLRNQDVAMRLRLTVEYAGEPPEEAISDGELRPMSKISDDEDEPVAQGHGVATVDFGERRMGFRLPSLFLSTGKPLLGDGDALEAITAHPESVTPYAEGARRVSTLLSDWFGVTPVRPLLLLDHPGQPFEDDALLVGQLAGDAEVDVVSRLLVAPLTHAWFRSEHPWIADGLAEFMRLLWTEREAGRKDAVAQLMAEDRTLALAEPATDSGDMQALSHATLDVFNRVKAAAVWWQLRDILGEDVLQQGLQAYRHSETLNAGFDTDPKAMQRTLEKVSGKELGWFFADWVDHDRGLPDLSIVQVNTRALPARPGKDGGYLVAVEVRNAGGAVAEVPVMVSSGGLTATERLRVTAGGVASVRIVFQGTPERVDVNDGATAEVGQPTHTFLIKSLE